MLHLQQRSSQKLADTASVQLDPTKLNSRGMVKLPGERNFASGYFGAGLINITHKSDEADVEGIGAHSPEGFITRALPLLSALHDCSL